VTPEQASLRADEPRPVEDPVDIALEDRGSFDDPQVRDAETGREDTTPPDHAVADTTPDARPDEPAAALRDDGGFDDPKVVDARTEETVDAGPADRDSHSSDPTPDETAPVAGGAAAGGAVAGAAGTGSAGAGGAKPGEISLGAAQDLGTKLFGDERQPFLDRWRDVQLQFVDNPKEATAAAAGLVDEVVDKLAATLRSQKAALSGDGSEDTEKLRVELRGYREMLNRILDL
jgi:hypothetical protein